MAKKNLGGKLVDIFFTTDMNEKEESVATPITPQPQQPMASSIVGIPPIQSVSTTTGIPVPTSSAGEVNQKMVDGLCAFLDEKNIPGLDYMELKTTATNLKEVLGDDTQCLKAAFVSLRSGNPSLTKETILSSIEKYAADLEEERKNGKLALAVKRKKEVDDPIASISAEMANIKSIEEQISTLQQEVIKRNAALTTLQGTIDATKATFDKQERDFDASVDFMVTQLQNDKAKITQVL